ncbi:MAG: dihydrolipoyl dehydrogenase [Kiritimatiellae bacterium]|nr:dihydrolipoyl dehydrogenase [Kiritimatiellia bacterium]
MHDIVIIGGGPGGYVAAIRAAQQGAKVALVEKDKLGGVCLHRGCVPSKTLLHSAELYRNALHAAAFGIEIPAPTVHFDKIMARKDQVVRTLHGGVEHLVKANRIELVRGEADLLSPTRVKVGDTVMDARHIIIAVGSSPALPPLDGCDDPCVITSDQALHLDQLPESMVIVGGGVIGVEMACLFRNLGTAVTIIELLDRIVPTLDSDLGTALRKTLKQQKIETLTGARVLSVKGGKVTFEHEGATKSCSVQKVLMAVGRRSNGLDLALDKVGVRHVKGVIETDAQLRTSVPTVYAIGDVNGKYMLAHVASKEGLTAVAAIMGRNAAMNYAAIPQCVYTIPEELASVGMTEEEARRQHGAAVKVGRFPLAANGKALATGLRDGFTKLIAGPDGEILGAHLMAPHATDMIATLAVAMQAELTPVEIGETVFPHPTVSETILEAAHLIEGNPIHAVR